MFKRNHLVKALAGSMILASFALAGCGGNTNQVDPNSYDDGSSYSDPSAGGGYSDPNAAGGYGQQTGGYGNTGTNPYGGATGTGAYSTPAQLTASVSKVKNGVFLGMGKCKVTVEVSNSGSAPATGTLTVTFTNGGKPTSHVETKQVSLGAGETQTFDFEDKKWSTDNATADVTTDTSTAPQTAGGYGQATGGYGSTTGAYGSTTGGYGATTGASTGYGTPSGY